ncbi:unnamed protein product [Dovyalis caffra]|uniref:Glutathione S-transferase n=1 Tax=Dovyalis caffra TaxID=77055 RepID=A0AAV1S4E4_9ROSI|nr:unnamed protein product [Dovyalis caffra]
MAEEVILLGILVSTFGMRVRIVMEEKGIEYEYKEENMLDKSPLLLQSNPVHKMVPVLIHNGKPICESVIILQYIDEVWKDKSPNLLPSDPYRRSQARFWVDFVDKKIYDSGKRILMTKGEVQEEAKEEMIESLKILEVELGDKLYFGGETFGFLDIAILPYYCWFFSYESCGGFSIEAECPKLMTWVQRCKEKESVTKSLADPQKVYDYVLKLQKLAG